MKSADPEQPRPHRDFVDWATLVIAFFGLAILVGTTIITQLDQASADATTARALKNMEMLVRAGNSQVDALQDQQRAWVFADLSMTKPVREGAGDYDFPIRITLNNVGHQPALHVVTDTEIIVEKKFRTLVPDAQQRICNGLVSGSNHGGMNTIFPGQRVNTSDIPDISVKEWRDAVVVDPDDGDRAVVGVLVGCIAYDLPGMPRHHLTQFAYLMTERIGSVEHAILSDHPEGHTPSFYAYPSRNAFDAN